jgi:hypothetical protein
MTPEQFIETVVSLTIQSALLVAVAYGACAHARPMLVRCRLWTACYVLLLLLAASGFLLPHFRPLPAGAFLNLTSLAAVGHWESRVGQWLFSAWLAGAAISLLLLIVGLYATQRRLNRCREVTRDELHVHPHDGDPMPDVPGNVRFVCGDSIEAPCCWHLHVPTIALPPWYFELSAQHREFILRHELEHLRLGHFLQLVLERMVTTLFWFHPAVLWGARQAALAREFACDEAVAADRTQIVEYLRALLIVSEQSARVAVRPSLLRFAGEASILMRRTWRLTQVAQQPQERLSAGCSRGSWRPLLRLYGAGVLVGAVWCPANVLSSPRANWSPWPRWTAVVLHDLGISVRDHEVYDRRTRVHEIREDLD